MERLESDENYRAEIIMVFLRNCSEIFHFTPTLTLGQHICFTRSYLISLIFYKSHCFHYLFSLSIMCVQKANTLLQLLLCCCNNQGSHTHWFLLIPSSDFHVLKSYFLSNLVCFICNVRKIQQTHTYTCWQMHNKYSKSIFLG